MPNSGKSGIFDWWHISQAEKSFQNKNYEKALEEFSKIENHDEKFFNIGNVLYRENKFDEAIKNFSKVTSSELKQKALYNIGNSYVQLNKLRKAVKSYQEALKFLSKYLKITIITNKTKKLTTIPTITNIQIPTIPI